jgi:hypothetical protein
VCGSRAVFNIGAVFGRKEAGHVGLGGPLDERGLGQDGVAADARDYYVDIWRVAASVMMMPTGVRREDGCGAPLYALLTSCSLDRSPVRISAPWLFRESIWDALSVTVAEEVRIAMRPKLDLALRIALVIGAPITPVAPMTSIFRGMLSDKSAPLDISV